MMHLSRSTLNVVVVVVVVLVLAALAGCWVTRQPAAPPPGTAQGPTPTRTAIPITVRPVTSTPTESSPTNPPTSTPRTPASPATMTRTYTANPSTLVTPSPQVLPATGKAQNPNLVTTLLAGGVALLLIGLLARWATAKPKG